MARGRGEGSVYLAKSGLWTAAVALPPDPLTGRRRRKVVRAKTKAEAVRKMRAVQLELAAAGDLPTGRAPTLAQWLTTWLERDVLPALKPSTAADYRTSVERHIIPAIGSRRLDRLTAADVRAVHARVAAAGASTSTAAPSTGRSWPKGSSRRRPPRSTGACPAPSPSPSARAWCPATPPAW